ncbi:MAG: glycosyltransferase family 2 protein [Actinomycetota bacterium]|nr:glycosyltransferase family 2 protein [Actinomycetota bacterium]
MRLLVIVPFLNEEQYLGKLLESIGNQTRPPDRLLLTDDGSADDSPRIASDFVRDHLYSTLLRRPVRPLARDRLAAASELSAFQWAVEQAEGEWDVVAKLDADVRLTSRTFATVERELEGDPRLGMTGPYLSARGAGGALERQRCPANHVEGPTKFYRRECLEQISPLPTFLGWDTIDEIRARMRGWRTASIAMPDGDPEHLRPMGSHDGLLRAHRRWGTCAWGYGEHPLHVMLVGVQRLCDRPAILGSLNYVLGWAIAGVGRRPRAEPELREYVHRDQLRRIRRRMGNLARG